MVVFIKKLIKADLSVPSSNYHSNKTNMKQIIFLLLTACCMTAKGQHSIKWDDTLRVATMQYYDSVCQPKCQHIYVAVLKDTVKTRCYITTFPSGQHLPGVTYTHSFNHDDKGLSDGVDIICIRCHHLTRQKFKYEH